MSSAGFVLLLMTLPGQVQRYAPPPVQAQSPPKVQELTDRMARQLSGLQEDIQIEVPDYRGQVLLAQADNLMDQVRHLQKSIRSGADPEHVRKHAAELARGLHEFMEATEALGEDGRYLNRTAKKVNDADRELMALLTPAVPVYAPAPPVPPPPAPVIVQSPPARHPVAGQTSALLLQVQAFRQAELGIARGRPYGEEFSRDTNEFVETVEHVNRSAETGSPTEYLRHDYEKAILTWSRVNRHLNQLSFQQRLLLMALGQEIQVSLDDLGRRLGH